MKPNFKGSSLYELFAYIGCFVCDEIRDYFLAWRIEPLRNDIAIREIKKQDNEISVLGTAIYSADQAILAAHAGCDYIAPYIKRMERADLTPYETIKAVRGYLDREELPTKIMGASFESAEQVIKILDAGAHTVTISPEVYREMAEKQIANNAITVFNEDALSLR